MSKEVQSSQTKAHIRYKNAAGEIVPGVTTIVGLLGLGKQQLINWANKKGLEGTDTQKYTKEKQVIGTLAHKMVTDHLQGLKTETKEYSPYQVSAAENSFLSYLEWEKGKKIEPILIEKPLVSESLQVGGTADIYAKVDGLHELIDLKTGGIYNEAIIQVCAYRYLLIESGYLVDRVRIVSIPRDDDDGFSEKVVNNTDAGMDIFLHLLMIHKRMKELNNHA